MLVQLAYGDIVQAIEAAEEVKEVYESGCATVEMAKAIELQSKNSGEPAGPGLKMWWNRGRCERKLGLDGKAIASFRKCFECDKTNPDPVKEIKECTLMGKGREAGAFDW